MIVVLKWNGKRVTGECLASLKEIDYSNYEIVLVDNGSTDGSQEYFRAQYAEIALLENEMNLGFAEGNNVGIRHAMNGRADYILLLNNDTFVHPKFLSELVCSVAETFTSALKSIVSIRIAISIGGSLRGFKIIALPFNAEHAQGSDKASGFARPRER